MKNKFKQKGFTLIETLIAILILSISIGGILSLAAGSFYSVRYARNQIVANNLLQESLEYVRNTRDSSFIQGVSWESWQDIFKVNSSGVYTGGSSDGCFSSDGCIVDVYTSSAKIKQCPGACSYIMYYPDNAFYGYNHSYPFSVITAAYQTTFIRTIRMSVSSDPNQIIVTGSISWLNNANPKTISQQMLITNWTP